MATKSKDEEIKRCLKVMQEQVKPSSQLEAKALEYERVNGSVDFLKLIMSSLNSVLVLKGVITTAELQSMLEAQIDESNDKNNA